MSPEDRLREFGIELPVVPALDGRRQGYVGSGGMAVEVEAIVALA
jgi:hypothetical protein